MIRFDVTFDVVSEIDINVRVLFKFFFSIDFEIVFLIDEILFMYVDCISAHQPKVGAIGL